jgi:hypothetical protein
LLTDGHRRCFELDLSGLPSRRSGCCLSRPPTMVRASPSRRRPGTRLPGVPVPGRLPEVISSRVHRRSAPSLHKDAAWRVVTTRRNSRTALRRTTEQLWPGRVQSHGATRPRTAVYKAYCPTNNVSPRNSIRASPVRGIARGPRLCDLEAQERTTATTRFKTERAVTHGNGTSSGGTGCGGSSTTQESVQAAPGAEQRLLSARERLDC